MVALLCQVFFTFLLYHLYEKCQGKEKMSDRTSGHLVNAVFERLMQKGIEAGGIAAGKTFSGDDIPVFRG